ncbi:MAG: putative capsular polysaccharide synthesis family protein [Candidatus Woesearchaeota archaeon]
MKQVIEFLRYIKRLLIKKEIVLVYTMGKVGSTTVYKTIKKHCPKKLTYHVHFLSDNYLNSPNPNKSNFDHNRRLAKNIRSVINLFPNKRIKIISLVRDPISRDISNVFENPKNFIDKDSLEKYSVPELIDIYQKKETHTYTLNWFSKEFQNYTNINIYNYPFQKEDGFSIIKDKEFEVLLIKMEYLNENGSIALSKFLKVKIPELELENMGAMKTTKMLQKKFAEQYVPNKSEINTVYNSTLVNHFYSEKEINNLKNKWNQK